MTTTKPSARQRSLAVISLLATVLALVAAIVILLDNLVVLLVALVGVALTIAGGWWLITERMPRRAVGVIGLVLGLAVIVLAVAWAGEHADRFITRLLLLVVPLGIAIVAARFALEDELHSADHALAGDLFEPQHPVLICNEKSGGGKVGRFGLLERAAELGVETVVLKPGDDLAQLARDAVARGADALAMAGGDGSQALVASVAVQSGLPFVCIPAGTRNHFALDLGLDREDPRKAMAAFERGVLRRIDYATAGERLFVNNVSLGVYATIVQSDDYRDAKVATSRELLPDLVGRTAEPFDLQFTGPNGEEVSDVFVILVSNNPYVVGASLSAASRPSMTTGKLGVVAARARTGADAVAVLAEATLGLRGTARGLMQFETEEFEVRSHGGSAYAGIDGEALQLPTPLRFAIHPGQLTVLVPLDAAEGPAPKRTRRVDVRALWRIAAGSTDPDALD